MQADKIIKCQHIFKQLVSYIAQLNQLLAQNEAFLQTYCYQIGQLNPAIKASPILQSGGLVLAKSAFNHFKLDAGDIVKHVVRYPGLISVQREELLLEFKAIIDLINQIKDEISWYISEHGRPREFKNSKGQLQYVKNDLIYNALPMVNHGMLKRHIVCYETRLYSASFGWNIDFNHENIQDLEAYKEKLYGRMLHPPTLVSLKEWQNSIETVINKVDRLVNDGVILKVIRPKPVEPKMYAAFNDTKKTIRPRLPIIAYGGAEHVSLKKTLKPPKHHPLEIKNSGKYHYEKLSPFLYLYACRKID